MRKILILLFITVLLTASVSALEYSAPAPPMEAEKYMPDSADSFWKDLLYIIKQAIAALYPSIHEAIRTCITILAIAILTSILNGFGGMSSKTVDLAGTIAVGTALLQPSNALINIGIQNVESLSEYGKLFLPVMASALAAEGATITSTAIYTGTMVFNTVLTSAITTLLVPLLYAFLALSLAKAAIDEQLLKNIHNFLKWLITWTLKLSIYLFTGYLGITGVISGTADTAAVKAAKLAISGSVPVVGSIISDASETILVSAGVMKSAVGSYGLLAILATWIGPFLQIGFQYLILKLTRAVSGIFGSKHIVALIDGFSVAMGFLVALTGTICLLLLISTVCFMKGVR